MKSPIVKRSAIIAGHRTSVSIEDAFWNALKEIAAARNMKVSAVIAEIGAHRQQGNLSSAIRVFVLNHYRSKTLQGEGFLLHLTPGGHPPA